MLKKTITYTDYNGNKRTEDFYFNLTKAEFYEWEMSVDGGMLALLQKAVSAQSVPTLANVFKELILKAYGEKSPDGRRFIKSPELAEAFTQTEAYSELDIELATNDEAAAAFIKGILPTDLVPNSTEVTEAVAAVSPLSIV